MRIPNQCQWWTASHIMKQLLPMVCYSAVTDSKQSVKNTIAITQSWADITIADSNQSCHKRTPRQTSLASPLSLSGKRHRVSVSAWTSIRRACFRRQSDRNRPGTRIAGRGQHSPELNYACSLRHMCRRALRIPNWTCCRTADEICKKQESSLLRWFCTISDTHNVQLNSGVSS